MSSTKYAFSNRIPQADAHLNSLAAVLDPVSTRRIAETGLEPGHTCWELGAGGGSIAYWLADQVGPTGKVVATDLDPHKLVPADNLEVLQQDVREQLPAGGPFDLIHARLVLIHLPERKELLRQLVGALRPGGWLVVEEFDCLHPQRVVTAPEPSDAEAFRHVLDGFWAALTNDGVDLTWAREVHAEMIAAGLSNVDTVEHSSSWTGGGPGFTLHEAVSSQKHEFMLANGVTPEELARVRELTTREDFCAMSYLFTSIRGQKPTA